MTDEPQLIAQNEIEELLRMAAGGNAPTAAATPPPASPAEPRSAPARPAPSDSAPRADADIQFLLRQAEEAIASIDAPATSHLQNLTPYRLEDLGGAPANAERATLDLLRDVELDLKIELGRTHMYLEEVLKLRRGSVVALDKLAGDPVDIIVNGRLVARGEVLVLNDSFCVRVAELVAGDDRK